jgi:NADH dehydrogenase
VFEIVIGRKINVNHIAPGEPVPGLPPLMAQMLAGLNFFDSPMEMKALANQYGVELTSIEQFAKDFITKKGKE